MAGITRGGFLAIAVVFHLAYIFSIFDIYFVSPIVSGMRLIPLQRPSAEKAPADRLVLFVGDGLRADKAFQSFPDPYPKTKADLEPRPLAPYLRSRVLEHGTFGVSHTRVPTESRPGHVALIAGLYEDVSAVTTGWKLNPVNFDSVFNRSQHTWSWGSPDILDMFETGAVPGRVDAYTYGAEMEDFSQDALELDYWVFERVKGLFEEAQKNKTLGDALRQEKVVFFLHLLGIDTTGHAYRPYSPEYLRNIQVVDQGVKEITELIENFYKDDRTAFVFTADHGMSDFGSHGDGHPDNTRTPLIAWGSGVAKPRTTPGEIALGHDEFSADWNLDQVQRHDVDQADVAALMAHLAGLEFPANSVGELPLPYLASDIAEKATAYLVNAQEILEMYGVKEAKKKSSQLRFVPYKPLSEETKSAERRVADIRVLLEARNFEEAIEETSALIKIALEGLRYLQTYDWLFLRALVTIGYLGWMAYALTTVIDLHVLQGQAQPSRTTFGVAAFASVLTAMYASFLASGSPPAYFVYAFFPVFFWEEVYARRESLARGGRVLFGHIQDGSTLASFLFGAVIYVIIIQSLAMSYIHREVLTVLFVLASFWPTMYGLKFIQENALLASAWVGLCLLMSSFTLLDANKVENISLILIGGLLMVTVGVAYLAMVDRIRAGSPSQRTRRSGLGLVTRTIVGFQVGLTLLAMFVTKSSAMSLQAKQGLPRGNQVVGWLVFVVSFLTPLAYRFEQNDGWYFHRLVSMFLTCAPTFVILTISYEGLFYFAFWATLLVWVLLEHKVYQLSKSRVARPAANGTKSRAANGSAEPIRKHHPIYRPLGLADARVALFFFVLLQAAFFSTGNVASISAFSLDSVYRLLPVFDPFSQGALLIVKIMIPFALISANLGILNKRLGVAPSSLFMLVMAISDVLTLYFFWVVKDEGSWLEIGSTISHFVIASLLCVFVALLEGVSAIFIRGVELEVDETTSAATDAELDSTKAKAVQADDGAAIAR